MYILIIDDDPDQFKYINRELLKESSFPIEKIERITTELEFRERYEEIAENNPDIIIVDIMIRWTNLSRHMTPPPKEIEEDGFYRAGLRIINMLNEDARTRTIPIIVYSILNKEDIEKDIKDFSQVRYLFKDFDMRKMIKRIQTRVGHKIT